MCKKFGLLALLVVVGLVGLSKVGLLRHARTAWHSMARTVSEQIPLETKLETLRSEVAGLSGTIKGQASRMCEEEIAVERLRKQIAVAQGNLKEREEQLQSARTVLDKTQQVSFVSFGGKRLPRDQFEASLARKWDLYRTTQAAVKTQEELLVEREKSLELAKEKLEAMQNKRKELAAKVERLDLELKRLRVAQVKNDAVNVDDSGLSEAQKLYDELETAIGRERRELEMTKAVDVGDVIERAMENEAKTKKALKEMDEHFATLGGQSPAVAADKK